MDFCINCGFTVSCHGGFFNCPTSITNEGVFEGFEKNQFFQGANDDDDDFEPETVREYPITSAIYIHPEEVEEEEIEEIFEVEEEDI